MNGPELFRLGRRLMKLGVHATPTSGFRELPTSVRIVLVDVHEHPNCTIGQIVARTGFPQSHVSAAVARLRDDGLLETAQDPNDRRRTVVTPTRSRAQIAKTRGELKPIDDLLTRVLIDMHGAGGAEQLPHVLAALDTLALAFHPAGLDEPATTGPGGSAC